MDDRSIDARVRRLAAYVEPERRAFFASQLDQVALFGQRDDPRLAELLDLPLADLEKLHAEEWSYAAQSEARLAQLAGDAVTLERLFEHWRKRLDWKSQLIAPPADVETLKLRVRDRIFDVVVPATLESHLLIFEIFLSEPYRQLPEVPLIYDFGAHIGLAAIYFAASFPAARLICVEPVPRNLELLRENIRRNALPAEIIAAAVGRERGMIELHECPEARSLSSSFAIEDLTGCPPGHLSMSTVSVESRSFRDLIGREEAGLKLDIEGAEHALVEMPEVLDPIRWIAGELHLGPNIVDVAKRGELVALLRRNHLLELDGPGVFGDTVTYTFRGLRPRKTPMASSPEQDQSFTAIVEALEAGARGAEPYRYHDTHDHMERIVHEHQKREEERRVWTEMLSAVSASSRSMIALDAGCGLGVYVDALAERFARVLAIDADNSRIEAAKRAHRSERVSFLTVPLQHEALRDPALAGRFDFVQCIQVLGHVPLQHLVPILKNLAAVLAPDGLLLLSVPYTNREQEDFRIAELRERETVGDISVDPGLYEALAKNPESGRLPVHHFTMPSLLAVLRAAGLRMEKDRPYNWFSYERADLFALVKKRA